MLLDRVIGPATGHVAVINPVATGTPFLSSLDLAEILLIRYTEHNGQV